MNELCHLVVKVAGALYNQKFTLYKHMFEEQCYDTETGQVQPTSRNNN